MKIKRELEFEQNVDALEVEEAFLGCSVNYYLI